jgi:hypothetical protein
MSEKNFWHVSSVVEITLLVERCVRLRTRIELICISPWIIVNGLQFGRREKALVADGIAATWYH